jgi:hypothetical protein
MSAGDAAALLCADSKSRIREPSTNCDLAAKMDALIGLLESTAYALAAEWDIRSGTEGGDLHWNGGGFEPTIQ